MKRLMMVCCSRWRHVRLEHAAAAQAKALRCDDRNLHSPWHKALLKFKEIVDTDSKGPLRGEHLYRRAARGHLAALSAMQIGTVEFGYSACLQSVSCGRRGMNVIYVPYLFKDAESAERILNNDEFNAIYARIGETAACACSAPGASARRARCRPRRVRLMKPED
jgi:TRAP-type C4-dicarboxylate transport system substrate-binding protein